MLTGDVVRARPASACWSDETVRWERGSREPRGRVKVCTKPNNGVHFVKGNGFSGIWQDPAKGAVGHPAVAEARGGHAVARSPCRPRMSGTCYPTMRPRTVRAMSPLP